MRTGVSAKAAVAAYAQACDLAEDLADVHWDLAGENVRPALPDGLLESGLHEMASARGTRCALGDLDGDLWEAAMALARMAYAERLAVRRREGGPPDPAPLPPRRPGEPLGQLQRRAWRGGKRRGGVDLAAAVRKLTR